MNKDLITQMIVNCYERRHSEFDQRYVGHPQYTREFKTARIELPRAHGHTSAAIDILNRYPNSILFVPTSMIRNGVRQMVGNDSLDDRIEILPSLGYEDLLRNSIAYRIKGLGDKNFNIVMFDPTHMYKEGTLDYAKMLLDSRTELFVELG